MDNKTPIDDLRTEIQEHPTTLDLVSSLMNDDNIEMKTEIVNPYALDTMMIIATYLEKHNYEINAKIIKHWVSLLLKYMVSNKRKSREEIKEILKGYFTLEREKEKKIGLMSNLAKQQSTVDF